MKDSFDDTINRACGHLPHGLILSLHMENGAAWVTLDTADGVNLALPDSADCTIYEQLNDALCAANGFEG